uniref:Uncharacterized protein n=1 Tax=Rhabditophanes sp. KR3021 TaxID=114890 RepID=A0AC35U837_9BILA
MDREMRLRAFMEDYTRLVQLLDNVITINETLKNIEIIVAILAFEIIGLTFLAVLFFFCKKCCCMDHSTSYDITPGNIYKTSERGLSTIGNGNYQNQPNNATTNNPSSLGFNNTNATTALLPKRDSFSTLNRDKHSVHSMNSPLGPTQNTSTFFKSQAATIQQQPFAESPKRSSIDVLNTYSSKL